MATSIAAWFNFLVLGAILIKKKFLILDIETLKIFIKGLFSSILMAAFIKYLSNNKIIFYNYSADFINKSLVLLSIIILGILIYLILMYLFKTLHLINPKRQDY